MWNTNIKIVAVFFLLTLPFVGFSQQKVELHQRDFDQIYGLEFYFDGGSNSLNNKLLSMMSFGGFVDDKLKDDNLKRMKDKNLFGKNFDLKIYYEQKNRKLLGKKRMGFQAAFEWHNLQEFTFNKELYGLVFYGNKSTAGRPVDISATAFNSLNYYQLKAGLNRISKSKYSEYGFNIALNLGNNYNAATFDNTTFYTSPSGDSVVLEGNINYLYRNLNGLPPFQINGLGAALDLFYSYDNPRLFKLSVKALNFGFIRWNKNSKQFIQSEPVVWQGLEVPNLLQMPDPVFDKSGSDSLKEYVEAHGKSAVYHSFTPATLAFEISRFFTEDKMEGVLKFDYRFFSFYRPMVLLQANFYLKDKFVLSPNVSYGGWTNFNFGFEFRYKISDYGRLDIGTKYLGGYLFQKNFSGFGGFITFTYQI